MAKITGVTLGALLLLIASGATADTLCFDEAGAQYGINPLILRAIAKVESDYNPRAINWNTNGTYDFGVMQINTIWAPTIGMERWNTLGDACANIKTGAMILAGCMKKYGYTWEAIGCYNSRTPDKRDRYAQKVFKQLQRLERDERELRKNLEAAVRDRIGDLVKAGQDSQGGELKLTLQPAVSSEVSPEPPLPVPGEQLPSPEAPRELRASSMSEGATNGM